MNAVNENLNPENAEKHSPKIPMLAAEHMGKSLVELVLQELRAAPDVWQKMSEKQQWEVIERVQHGVKYATAGAVNTIVTGGHTALAGTIDTVNIKDKIKLTVIVSKSNLAESLAELYAAGSESSCQILLADAAQYLGGMELVQAEPNQPELFSDEAEKPDDQLLWAINLPLITGSATMVPAPSHKDADLYARSIRAKLIELERTEFASSVYALPWPMNRGEHMRSFNKGNWESMINWFSKLCAGEVEVKPVALLEHAPELPDDHEVDYKPTDGFELVSVTKDFGSFGVKKKGLDFVAFVLGMDESDPSATATSPLSIEAALNALAAKQGLVGDFKFEETTTTHDELAQERIFKVSVTFNTDNAPEGDDVETQPETDDSLICHLSGFSKAYLVASGERLFKNQPTYRAALDLITRATIGDQSCMYEHTGWSHHPIHGGGQGYKIYPAIELTEDHPRIKVTFSNTNGYRATCNSKSATSTRTGRGAAENLLKKLAIEGQVFEITTLDDIEAEVQMFTVI